MAFGDSVIDILYVCPLSEAIGGSIIDTNPLSGAIWISIITFTSAISIIWWALNPNSNFPNVSVKLINNNGLNNFKWRVVQIQSWDCLLEWCILCSGTTMRGFWKCLEISLKSEWTHLMDWSFSWSCDFSLLSLFYCFRVKKARVQPALVHKDKRWA